MALRSALVLNGGADFDSVTGTQSLATLLAAMDRDARAAHVKVLVGAVAACANDRSAEGGGDMDVDDEDATDAVDDADADAERRALAAIDAMCQLVRIGVKADGKGSVCMMVLATLIRLSCFGAGHHYQNHLEQQQQQQPKSSKKRKKNQPAADNPAAAAAAVPQQQQCIDANVMECIRLLETPERWAYPPRVVLVAGQRLLTLLTDYSSLPPALMTLMALNQPAPAGDTKAAPAKSSAADEFAGSISILHAAWEVVAAVHASGVPLNTAAAARDGVDYIDAVSRLLRKELSPSETAPSGSSSSWGGGGGGEADKRASSQVKLQTTLANLLVLEGFRCILPDAGDTSVSCAPID